MIKQTIPTFKIIGISVRTTNENNQAATDIRQLWSKFMSENILGKIPNKENDDIYCIYTEYEKDHTRPYTTVLGCKVSSLDEIPVGLMGIIIEEAQYTTVTAKGNLAEGAVYNAWLNIWNADLPRTFKADFEVYGQKAHNQEEGEVDIFVSVK